MKNIFGIYRNDLKSIGTNWVAAILVGGLMLLPSLYAWVNISATWDPYGRTDQLPVAIVNEDKGAVVREEEIDVGADLIEQLQENDSMNWQFTDRDEAIDKVEYGDYFAAIIIPENFSEKLGTVVDYQPEKAEIEYFVNEKINAIAPKITESGASGIAEQITSEFISTVNGVIFEMFNDVGLELEANLSDIERFENYVFEMEETLPEAYQMIEDTLDDAAYAKGLIDDAQSLVPEAERVTDEGLQTIDGTLKMLENAEARLDEMAPRVEENLQQVQQMASEVSEFLDGIEGLDLDVAEGDNWNQQVETQMAAAIENIEAIEAALRYLDELNLESEEGDESRTAVSEEEIEGAMQELEQLRGSLEAVRESNREIAGLLESQQRDANEIIAGLQDRTENVALRIDEFVVEYEKNIEPAIRNEISSAKGTLSGAREILLEIKATVPEVERILADSEQKIITGEGTLQDIAAEYPYVNEKIGQLADRIREIQGETDLGEIIELLVNDPEAESGFFEEPVVVNVNSMFAMENYGTAMTPFYTVLSIWVGCLLMISVLSTEITLTGSYSGAQVYLGKLLTFISIGLIQALVVTSGDMLVLGVNVASPGWFILFGMFISLVFVFIVYTLVSVLGDAGKGLAIILLVLQIAGSGGTYPVELLPDFFQTIHPFLPFAYAIDLMREAVGGIVWERALLDMAVLSIFPVLALVIGTTLKTKLNKGSQALMKKSKESGLFH